MKKHDPEHLPEELLWAAGGHASDVALTALADGETSIVPPRVRAHVDTCSICTTHLGNAILLSLHTGGEIAVMRSEEAVAPARLPLPRLAIALGLVVAFIGFMPTIFDGGGDVRFFATREVPVLVSGLRTLGHRLLEPGSESSLVLTYGAAAMLVVFGLVLVRLLPKKEVSQ